LRGYAIHVLSNIAGERDTWFKAATRIAATEHHDWHSKRYN